MRLNWTEAVFNGFQNVISTATSFTAKPASDSGLAGRDNNSFLSPTSNASRSRAQAAQMPSFHSTRSHQTRNSVQGFLDLHDHVPSDPIAIESDEEDGLPLSKTHRGLSAHTYTPTQQPEHIRRAEPSQRTESRDESRLLGGRTRREPNAVSIPDPMKKAPFSVGHRPVNTLDAPRMTTARSDFYQRKTQAIRQAGKPHPNRVNNDGECRSNDHVAPSKRRKIDHHVTPGATSASAISLDDSKMLDDSADELQLTPQSSGKSRKTTDAQAHQPNHVPIGFHQADHRTISLDIPHDAPSSPKNEDDFTKGSTSQRKAEKDQLLASSPPASLGSSSHTTSPYFDLQTAQSSTRRKIQQQDQRRSIMPESPDVLQDESQMFPSSQIPYAELPIRDLFKQIVDANPKLKSSKKGTVTAWPSEVVFSDISDIVHSLIDSQSIYKIVVKPRSKTFEIHTTTNMLLDEPVIDPFPTNKITKVQHARGSILHIEFSRRTSAPLLNEVMYVKFKDSQKAEFFLNLLRVTTSTVVTKEKDADWIESAYRRHKDALHKILTTRASPALKTQEAHHQQFQSTLANTGGRPQRLVDRLDLPSTKQPTIISSSDRCSIHEQNKPNRIAHGEQQKDKSPSPKSKPDNAQQNASQARTTRSQISQQVMAGPRVWREPPKYRHSETGALGKAWATDLVYPKSGKRSATVPFEDLSRLDDDEFLNDNLISFFMQYLETYMETNKPELQKRTYFFNSYFFERLTQNVKGRGINYEAVSRWTKAIDIFSRDFVVVPVNENLHWYLAIICNLPSLREEPEARAEAGLEETVEAEDDVLVVDEATESIPQVQSDLNLDLEGRSQPPTEETQKSLAELTISDADLSLNEVSKPQPRKGPARRKPLRKSLPKYNPKNPVIITLDSLGASRSATCSLLKQYIIAEGKDKRQLDLDATKIPGMTAKDIPRQSNFSDCGLYLCMYLEQFVADPYKFVERILQREEAPQLWPRRIHSEDLRSRLRELILEIHRQQENESSEHELPEVGAIMIQKQDLLARPASEGQPMTKQSVEDASRRYEEVRSAPNQRMMEGDVANPNDDGLENRNGANSALESVNNQRKPGSHATIVHDQRDDRTATSIQNRTSRKRQSLREYVADSHQSNVAKPTTRASATPLPSQTEVPYASRAHNTPAELAANLRHASQEWEGRTRERSNAGKICEQKRSDSASTEFLIGIESYAQSATISPGTEPRLTRSAAHEADEATIEVNASPDTKFSQEKLPSTPSSRFGNKRKRRPQQSELGDDYYNPGEEIRETQESKQIVIDDQQSQEYPPPTSGKRGSKASPILGRRKRKPIERPENTSNLHVQAAGLQDLAERDAALDGEMLLQ